MSSVLRLVRGPGKLVFIDFWTRLGAIEVAGLDAEHEGHTDEHDEHQDVHQRCLLLLCSEQRRLVRVCRLASVHRHVEHGVNDGGGPACVIAVVREPLLNDHEVHETEQAHEHDKLWDELEGEIDAALVVGIVAALEEDAESHLNDTEDQGDLHLYRVDEEDLILSHVPDRVDTDGVDTVWLLSGEFLSMLWQFPARVEQIHAHGSEIIVDEATEDGEDAHQEQEMPAHHATDHSTDAGNQEKCTGKHVTKHNSEQEGERDGREVGRVDLLVFRHFILVDDHLSNGRNLALSEESRNGQLWVDFALNNVHAECVFAGELLTCVKELILLLRRHPDEANQEPVARLEHVEGPVDDLILSQELLVDHDKGNIVRVLQWVVNVQVVDKLSSRARDQLLYLRLLLDHIF